jgi:zona occludens toxin
MTQEQFNKAMTPLVIGVPWSAPIYASMAKPVSMPIVVGCVKYTKRDDPKCSCYTQQATIVDMPAYVCESYVKHHAFNHFRPDYSPGQENSANTIAQNQPQPQSFLK